MKHSILAATGAGILVGASGAAQAVPISGQGTWESTLQARDFDAHTSTIEGYYDTLLDITWLANASAGSPSMPWDAANAWAAGLNIDGITGWRLPQNESVNGLSYSAGISLEGTSDVGYNISAPGTLYAGSIASEMAHLFYNTLGNLGDCDPALSSGSCVSQPGSGLTNTGPFTDLVGTRFWSGSLFSSDYAFTFGFTSGFQDIYSSSFDAFWALAVHDGDVGMAVVPVPPAVWLLGGGLLGLSGVSSRRKASLERSKGGIKSINRVRLD